VNFNNTWVVARKISRIARTKNVCYFVGFNKQNNRSNMVLFLYPITPTSKCMSDYVGIIAEKRYRLYLKEEERKIRHSEWTQYIIAAILWLVKLITNSLEKVTIKSKWVIEKVIVE
jgi:hypothetical protein